MEADLLVVLGCDVQDQGNEVIHEDKGAVISAVGRVPGNGENAHSSLDELLHVVFNHRRIGGGVGTQRRVKPGGDVVRRLVLSLRVLTVHRLRPVGEGEMIPVAPFAVDRLGSVPGVVKGVDVVVHPFLSSQMRTLSLTILCVIYGYTKELRLLPHLGFHEDALLVKQREEGLPESPWLSVGPVVRTAWNP